MLTHAVGRTPWSAGPRPSVSGSTPQLFPPEWVPNIMLLDAELLRGIASLPVEKRAVTNLRVLNEAYDYARPSSFSRGMRIDLNGLAVLLISGTASIDEHGRTLHAGDFRAQMRRTLHNITGLLEAEDATWKDVVRTTCYLRDIERDYEAFNEERSAFYREQRLDPLPASTGIQAILCRPELLIEIEAIAMFRTAPGPRPVCEPARPEPSSPAPRG
jgi:2-iminobutanoate/2-iminopropanoate deaminase